ncbi:hypothetical protein SAMN04515617_117114 [Collimonas sp. OK242]|nr:hypothetical protein SAMN04515617_117114 [Collimonas sp. OK242]
MSMISATAAVVAICLSLVSLLANRERAKHRDGGLKFRMEKTLTYTLIAVTLISSCMALFWLLKEPHYQGQGDDAVVPAFIGFCAILCGLVFSSYEVRLGETNLYFGIKGRREISYSSIAEIHDIRNEGSPRMILVTNLGTRIGIWSNLLGYDDLVAELKSRCNCTYTVIKNHEK